MQKKKSLSKWQALREALKSRQAHSLKRTFPKVKELCQNVLWGIKISIRIAWFYAKGFFCWSASFSRERSIAAHHHGIFNNVASSSLPVEPLNLPGSCVVEFYGLGVSVITWVMSFVAMLPSVLLLSTWAAAVKAAQLGAKAWWAFIFQGVTLILCKMVKKLEKAFLSSYPPVIYLSLINQNFLV